MSETLGESEVRTEVPEGSGWAKAEVDDMDSTDATDVDDDDTDVDADDSDSDSDGTDPS